MIRHARTAGLVAAVTVALLSTIAFTPNAKAGPAPAGTAYAQAAADRHGVKPTIVLVHGAWADAAGWTPVVERLEKAGFPVMAPPNPLRGLDSDAQYISAVLHQISGPVVLVGHSYGGAVITNAAVGNPNVKALVYIAAFAPAQGDSLASLNGSAPGRSIPAVPAIPTSYPQPGGSTGTELTINPAKYPAVFLNNQLPPAQEQALAAEQKPLSLDAVTEPSGTPAWQTIPSWYMVAKNDRAIAPDLERFMATRADAHTIEVNGPHLIMLTNPGAVTTLVEQAARATAHPPIPTSGTTGAGRQPCDYCPRAGLTPIRLRTC
ncbi:alpha/beta hydrolase [Streptomyces sp. FH025]|uniref:alpha/beta fold hydrolase n=1 Tax=Streptomyces sp. FH025 TaxID=2815937 RepID=UPI0027DB7FDA|nr:alpha/beta hydrolase [Streptomyces sp. FH025]